MTKRRWSAAAGWLLVAAACGAAAGPRAEAREIRELTLRRGAVRLQLVALRPDILRVRAGVGRLPEDASWAVAAATRAQRVPLEVVEAGAVIVLRTAAMRIRLERRTLHLTVTDPAGRTLLDDVAGEELAFRGAAFSLHQRMPEDAHYFGLGDKTGPLDRRGGAFALWNTDAYGFDAATDPLYKSIPFVLCVREHGPSVGLFLDTTWRSHFDFGRAQRGTLVIGAEGGPVDYYVFPGDGPKAVLAAYAHLTGTPPLPPLWALGFQQSRYSYASEGELRGVATRLRAESIPADAIYLDIDYQDRNRPFTVARDAFPDLARLVRELRALDLNLVLITDLHIARAPGEGYRPYDSGLAEDVFLRRADGAVYVGDVWPGPSVFPDFSRAPVRDWWGRLYAEFAGAGVAGFWNDMNEPAVFNVRDKTMPLDTVHRIEEPGFASRTATHAEMHNVYGMLNSRATYEGLLRLRPDERPFVLTRASSAGGQRYAATWTGDNSSSWAQLRLSTPMLLNLGLSGFALVGADVGGFTGAGPPAELLTRWIEVAAFTPLFRDHAGKGKPAQEPFVGPPDQVAIRRRAIEERYRLLPYLYALAEEQSRTGVPMLRPVFLEFPEVLAAGERLGGTADEFMLGPDLLVAPAPEGESPAAYPVRLPGPGWFDYWTGARVEAATRVELPRLDRLPVFVRPGAMLVRQPLVQSTRQRPRGPLEVAVYPGPDCRGELYADDGVSFGYRQGQFLRRHLRCRVDGSTLSVDLEARDGRYAPWWSEVEVAVHGLRGAPARALAGDRDANADYDAASGTLRVRIGDTADPVRLRIELAR